MRNLHRQGARRSGFNILRRCSAASAITACFATILLGPPARAQDADDIISGLDDLAAAEMELLVEPPPDDAPFQRPTPPPEVRPHLTPPPPPGDPFAKYLGFKENLKKKYGTSYYLYLSFTPQYLVTGPDDGATRGVFWFNLNLTQDLWKDAQVISNVRGGVGRGMLPVINNILPTNWQQNETDDIYVSHLFFQQALFNKKLTLSLGKLDLDDMFDTNEVGSWNFTSYALARNVGVPVPWHVLAGVARWDPVDWLYLQAGTGDRNGEGGETGFDTTFGGDLELFSIAEVGIKPKLLGRPGTYRISIWHDSADQARFSDGDTQSGDWGFAFNFDQQITDKLGIFARYGFADGDVRALEHFWAGGLTYTGLIPGRDQDVLGLGIAQARISDDLRNLVPFESAETLLETYYKIPLWPGAWVTPDFQIVLDPGAMDTDTAFIAGVNFVMIF